MMIEECSLKNLSQIETVIGALAEHLPEDDVLALQSLAGELERAMDSYVIWRTPVEAAYAVLDDARHPTNASKYHQAILEQLTMLDALVSEMFEARRTAIRLKDVMRKLDEETNDIERELLEVDRDELMYKLYSLRRRMRDRVREIKMWQHFKDVLDDGTFDTYDRGADQLIALTKRECAMLPENMKSDDPGVRMAAQYRVRALLDTCQQMGVLDRVGEIASSAMKMLPEGR